MKAEEQQAGSRLGRGQSRDVGESEEQQEGSGEGQQEQEGERGEQQRGMSPRAAERLKEQCERVAEVTMRVGVGYLDGSPRVGQ